MTVLPSLFLSHGSPMIALKDSPARRFLCGIGEAFGRPNAILCVSAHWETAGPAVSSATRPETVHDFGGFPEALHRLRYPAPGAPALAARVAELLAAAGFDCALDPDQGLDHGAWVPLSLAYPEADVPVAQLSIQHHLGPAHHLAVGRALAPLCAEGVLVLGSGSLTHNLHDTAMRRRQGLAEGVPPPAWAAEFEAWAVARVEAGDVGALAGYRAMAPHAELAHPRDEHFLPLLAAAGAGGTPGRTLHRSFEAGSLSMAAFAFD